MQPYSSLPQSFKLRLYASATKLLRPVSPEAPLLAMFTVSVNIAGILGFSRILNHRVFSGGHPSEYWPGFTLTGWKEKLILIAISPLTDSQYSHFAIEYLTSPLYISGLKSSKVFFYVWCVSGANSLGGVHLTPCQVTANVFQLERTH